MTDQSEAERRLLAAGRALRRRAGQEAARVESIADTAEHVARLIYAGNLTLSEYLQERVSMWYREAHIHKFSIVEFLGFTHDEYAAWIMRDEISDRVERIQLSGYVSRVLRGHR